jgi:hypothetical protein
MVPLGGSVDASQGSRMPNYEVELVCKRKVAARFRMQASRLDVLE